MKECLGDIACEYHLILMSPSYQRTVVFKLIQLLQSDNNDA